MDHLLLTQPRTDLNLIKAQGEYYFDAAGNRYLDLESGIWCASLGHSHPNVTAVMKAQIDTLIHSGTTFIPEYIDGIAAKILQKAKIAGKALFLNTGSEAVDFAMTLAKLKNPHGTLTTFTDNYLSAYGQAKGIERKIDIWQCLRCQKPECQTSCEQLHDNIFEETIFIFDPFCFARAILEPPAKLIHTLETELRQKHGILILNEVTTGLGRTGKWFGYQHFDVQPDIVVLGKTLGNGYPVSCVMLAQPLVEAVESSRYGYAQSHQNDPLGCKIAEAVIDTLEQEQLVERADEVGKTLKTLLKNELQSEDGVIEIRGRGLLLGIELDKAISVENVTQRLLKQRIIIGRSSKFNMLNLFPPYTIDTGNLEQIVWEIKKSVQEERS